VSGGDDYEILCTIAENRLNAFEAAASLAGVPVTSIGTVIAGSSIPRFIDGQGTEIALPRLSYSHF
jgi:thiamine-monophosphate kinase